MRPVDIWLISLEEQASGAGAPETNFLSISSLLVLRRSPFRCTNYNQLRMSRPPFNPSPAPEDAHRERLPQHAPSEAQQSAEDGVFNDEGEDAMATLAVHPGMLDTDDPKARPLSASASIPLEDNDAALMLRLKAGDLSCFDLLLQKYRRPMMHFMFRMVHNQAVAEELAQEVFLRVYRSRETYRAEARFSTWLYRIATNLAVNHARDNKHERAAQMVHLDEPDEDSGTMPDVADQGISAEANMLRQERMRAIRNHIEALPERQKMAVLMHKYEEMDYKQIGEVLKLSESATKSLLFRAYQTLRERLKDFVA